MVLNKTLQEINLANMDTELVSQMFKNYQSNVLFHLEGMNLLISNTPGYCTNLAVATNGLKDPA